MRLAPFSFEVTRRGLYHKPKDYAERRASKPKGRNQAASQFLTLALRLWDTITLVLKMRQVIRVFSKVFQIVINFWPSACGARAAFSWEEQDYLRSLLSRRQLQGFIMRGARWKLLLRDQWP